MCFLSVAACGTPGVADFWQRMSRVGIVFSFAVVLVVRFFGIGLDGFLKQGMPGMGVGGTVEASASQFFIFGAFIAAAAATFVYVVFPGRLDQRLAPPGFGRCLGILCIFASAVLLHCTHAAMGKAWNPYITILPGQALVTAFPFSMVRHPMYSSCILMGAGTTLAAGSIVVAFAWSLCAAAVIARVPAEEAVLVGHFGEMYSQYMASVPHAVLPGIF